MVGKSIFVDYTTTLLKRCTLNALLFPTGSIIYRLQIIAWWIFFCKAKTKINARIFSQVQYWFKLCKGRPFDSEGRRGGLAYLVGTDFVFLAWACPENLISGIQRPEYLFSSAIKFWKSNKKKITKGGGFGMMVQKGGRNRLRYVPC